MAVIMVAVAVMVMKVKFFTILFHKDEGNTNDYTSIIDGGVNNDNVNLVQ